MKYIITLYLIFGMATFGALSEKGDEIPEDTETRAFAFAMVVVLWPILAGAMAFEAASHSCGEGGE